MISCSSPLVSRWPNHAARPSAPGVGLQPAGLQREVAGQVGPKRRQRRGGREHLETHAARCAVLVLADECLEPLVLAVQGECQFAIGVDPETELELAVAHDQRVVLPILVQQQLAPADTDARRFEIGESGDGAVRGNQLRLAPDVAVGGPLARRWRRAAILSGRRY